MDDDIRLMTHSEIVHSYIRKAIVIIIAIISAIILITTHSKCTNPVFTLGNTETATITSYVDGDTFYVDTKTEKHIKIRLIGIDTPESVNPDPSKNTQEGIIASDYIKNNIPLNTTIWLEYGSELCDKYNRTLCYVWMNDPANLTINYDSIKTNMLNGILLDKKLATTLTIEPNTKYANIFTEIEQKTKE